MKYQNEFNFTREPTFHPAKAVVAREEAISRVDEHANLEWKDCALTAVMTVASVHAEFITDAVWAGLEELDASVTTHDGRAMGAVMRQAHRMGFITPTDRYAPSSRVKAHRRPMRIWKSELSRGLK